VAIADNQIDWSSAEWTLPPIIQSGGKYDLKLSAQSNGDSLKPGVILCTLGMRYKNYCSSMGRTFMIDPHPVSFLWTVENPS
jgi:nucleosome binding factor SPN SPT16 subunit